MSVPTRIELTNPTLQAIHEAGGSASINEITERVIKKLGISDDDANETRGTGHRTTLEHRLGWARTDLRLRGLITNSVRGVWSLTPEGQKETSIARRGAASAENETVAENDDAEEPAWQEQILDALMGMDPSAFERLCQRMLRESGFIEVKVTGRPGDGGIDGHGIFRMGGLISFPVLFQCKRYQGSVGPDVVQKFRGAMQGRSDKGAADHDRRLHSRRQSGGHAGRGAAY